MKPNDIMDHGKGVLGLIATLGGVVFLFPGLLRLMEISIDWWWGR